MIVKTSIIVNRKAYEGMAVYRYCVQNLIDLAVNGKMEVVLSPDRYAVMEQVSKQEKEFRFAEIYHLLKNWIRTDGRQKI